MARGGLVWLLLCFLCETGLSFKQYTSCKDVQTDLGTSAPDGEYIISLNNGVGVSIYCQGLSFGPDPSAFLSLPAGRSKNFAYYYENVGSNGSCADSFQHQLYDNRGRSEFSKVKVNLQTLVVDVADYTFAKQTGYSQKNYATAGDFFASSSACSPQGAFQVDLEGTPFSLTPDTTWSWHGNLISGNTTAGVAKITNSTYLGCWLDRTDRLLPAGRYDDPRHQTVEKCTQHCRQLGFKYAGLQYSVECHCGNNYNRYGSVPEANCNKRCSGNPAQTCGGTWRASIYSTSVAQNFVGRCGGFPGHCFPASKTNPSALQLKLQIVPGHICLRNPCFNEGKCVATSSMDYKCVCYDNYSGKNCDTGKETIADNSASCPAGYQAETCMCFEPRCNGAKFDGDNCIASTNHSQVICRPGDPGHVILFNKNGYRSLTCPKGATIVGCSYWSNSPWQNTKGQGQVLAGGTICKGCSTCQVQVRCKQYVCGCKNGAHCNTITGKCVCPPGYYGNKCETFDFCSYYEDHNNGSACGKGGICSAIPKTVVKAYGGDKVSDTCVFPFEFHTNTYSSCINDNQVGPPFACAGVFDKASSYIDLGPWSPGRTYTLAAWVRPATIDTIRRTVAGGVSHCNDFGFNLNSGTFRGFLKMSQECSVDLDAGPPQVITGKWYLVAVTNNGSHSVIYVNGQLRNVNTVLLNHIPTSVGFRIGGEVCCPNEHFSGMIKTVKVWKRALNNAEISRSMNNIGISNSSTEALYDGLVGHWETGMSGTVAPCLGTDHGGEDWVVSDGQQIAGTHCNISRFYVPKGVAVTLLRYNGTTGGKLDVTAKEIVIDGYIDGEGSGYRGGRTSSQSGAGGQQGESYIGTGKVSTTENRGGGGGGGGSGALTDGKGRPGGGAGYGMAGSIAVRTKGAITGLGAGGRVYGDSDINVLYMGAGGGSGGNPRDLTVSPTGGRGGNGGGAVRLTAERSVTVTGTISVKGTGGQGDMPGDQGCMTCPQSCGGLTGSQCASNNSSACWDDSGPGGGGAGGSIYISGKLVDVGFHKLWVNGGSGGTGVNNCGGAGAVGRIRIDSVILKGSVGTTFKSVTLSDKFVDYSQAGQKQIDYKTTVHGNEVYRGCFIERNATDRKLGYQAPLTAAMTNKMTPAYCQQLCRQKGYMFSGTQFGHECFCDNHLDLTDKTDDSDCKMACSGDALQTCGAFYRIQVLGPPPSTPALGHNVVPKCEPWCATADPFSPTPKWGQCSGVRSITDWDVHCECPPGYRGANCDQPCPYWTYGRACSKACQCNKNSTGVCSPNNGACQCKPGFTGVNCTDVCPQGFFGQNCRNQCNCSENTVCEPKTGTCICKPGWMGAHCNFPCPPHKYGKGCNQSCDCFHGSCSPEDGTCECDPGYELPNCYLRCDPTNYGQDCLQHCDCNNQFCEPVTGQCRCSPGYIGHKCEILCPHGTYGQDCAKKCNCQGGFGCDHITGECICGPGFLGETCQLACTDGTFGSHCMNLCSCVRNKTSVCNVINGACDCLPGYKGDSCEQRCMEGFYGEKCQSTCSCLHGAKCDPTSGKCLCPPGFIGNKCEVLCSAGFYGNQCQGVCPACPGGVCSKVDGTCICQPGQSCVCPKGFWGSTCQNACSCIHGDCDPATGACTCSPGWTGTNCDQLCAKGLYGQNCGQHCACLHGSCDPVTGSCHCSPGFSGAKCDVACKNGTYGVDCRFPCSPCGAYAFPGCDAVTGNCKCSDGYTGGLCDRPCPNGNYGANCSRSCSCLNGGYCESVKGTCICKPGFTGVRCQNSCPKGTWGVGCSSTCDCGPHGASCSPDEGVCICQPGFTGVKCRQSCASGFYGLNCSRGCDCDPFTSYCSPVDGSCQCHVGFHGDVCGLVCPIGKWGKGCSQTCQCNNRGSCNPFNGQCACDKGYKGPHCAQQCLQDVYYGKNCEQRCNCTGAYCDHRDGSCRCPPGRIGFNCELTCDSRHFGFQCAQLCGCKNNGVCDHVTGSCRCQPGWSGDTCEDKCPDGYYGTDCSMNCPECQNGGSCDTFSGVCLCRPTFTGALCNQSVVIAAPTSVTTKPLPARQGMQAAATVSGIHFSVGQLVGLVLGMLILAFLVAIVSVFVTRQRYLGRFGGTEGAVKFQGEEVDIGAISPSAGGASTAPPGSGTTSFVNPVHVLEEGNLDSKSEISTATSGVASGGVDSDEEEEAEAGYFKDSSA